MVRWLHGRELREYPFLAVVALVLVALLVAVSAPQHWLRAVLVLATAFGVAGLLRLMFSDRQAGMLKIRGRLFDVTCYWILAFLTGFFGVVSPGR